MSLFTKALKLHNSLKARLQGTQLSIATLKEDLKNNDTATFDDIISSYFETLREIFVVEDIPA